MWGFEFFVSEGPGKGQTFAFPGESFLIGSGADCSLRFENAAVQARHAQVFRGADGFPWVRSLAAGDALWVNGEAVSEASLLPGTFLRLGGLELVMREIGHRGSGTVSVNTPVVSSPAGNPMELGLDKTSPSGPRPAFNPDAPRGEALQPGMVIDGRYQIVERLAAGGMGEVYKASHVELGKTFALKVMLPELSKDPDFVARFKREAIAASRIGQQNIVDISDFGQTPDGRFYFVMEFLDGMTLASVIHRTGAVSAKRVVDITIQVARALAAAHSQGIVHRDLKPDNVMVLQRPGQADFVKVLDFGVAKVAHGHGQGGQTAFGLVVGTPQYMSPEQAQAIAVDYRSDIYSLGLIVYELLTGRPTFVGATPSILMVKHITEAPPPLVPGPLEAVPKDLESLVFHLLAKEPPKRPQSMEEVIASLEQVRFDAPAPPMQMPAPSSSSVRPARTPPPVVTSAPVPAPSAIDDEPIAVPGRSKAPLFVLGALALAGLGVGGFLLSQKPAAAEPSPQPLAATPAAQPALNEPAPVPVPVPVPVATRSTLTFKSEPPHVEVFEGDVLLGTTPLAVSRENGTVSSFTFALKGYKSSTRKVGFSADTEVKVTLPVEKKPGKKRKSGKPDLMNNPYAQDEELKDLPD